MDHDAQGSSTHDSTISGLSILASETDEFYQQNVDLASQADKRRIQALVNTTLQPFRKARPRTRVALTMENLERNNASANALKESHRDASNRYSTSGSDSTGATNMPRQWGRKGIQRNDFLRRINSTGNRGQPEERPNDPDSIFRRRTLFTGDSFISDRERPASAGVDTATSLVGDDSPVAKHLKRHSMSGTQCTNQSLDCIIELEKEQPIITDSQAPSKSDFRRSDSTRQQEIDRLKEKAVTTNRLAEDRGSLRRPRLADAFRKTESYINTVPGDLDAQQNPSTSKAQSTQPLPDSLKGQKTVGLSSDATMAKDALLSPLEPGKKSSHELLRQFARASTSTPSPSSGSPKKRTTMMSPRAPGQRYLRDNTPKSQASPQAERVTPKLRTLGLQPSLFDPQLKDRTSAEVSPVEVSGTISPPRSRSASPPRSTSKAASAHKATKHEKPVQSALRKTPVVTGAWVDTPKPRAIRRRLSDSVLLRNRTADEHPQEPSKAVVIHKPSHAKSALEALLKDPRTPKTHREEDAFGDATMASLQDLAAPEASPADGAQSLLDIDDDTLDLVADVATPLHAPKSFAAQRQEQLALQRMARTLRTARHGLRDTSRLIQSMEDKVQHDTANNAVTPPNQHSNSSQSSNNHAGRCRTCGSHRAYPPVTLGTVLRATFKEFIAKLVYTDSTGRLRPNGLGFFVAFFGVWCVIEFALYECCTVNPLDYAGPRFAHLVETPRVPFVTFEIAARQIRAYWRPAMTLFAPVVSYLTEYFFGGSIPDSVDVWESAAPGRYRGFVEE